MSTALLLGFPQGYVRAAKRSIERSAGLFTDWSIKYVPSNGHATGIAQRDVHKIEDFVERDATIHVIGFSDQKNRKDFSDQIAPFFRFRWFAYELLKCLGSPDSSRFVNGLADDLAEEIEWETRVKPTSLNSPLLLPECAFKAQSKHENLWRHALAYGDIQNVIGAVKAIESFRITYRQKVEFAGYSANKWIDNADRVFDEAGPRHAPAPYPRNWKYSYGIETGFHFDVRQLRGHQFSVFDATGTPNLVRTGGYINIDPHGYVRR
jgi:hypothetical protein